MDRYHIVLKHQGIRNHPTRVHRMGNAASQPAPLTTPVPEHKTRICIAGIPVCPHCGRARKIASYMAKTYPDKFETWFHFTGQNAYSAFLRDKFDAVPFPPHLKGHSTAPFVWLERRDAEMPELIGGRDHFCEWLQREQAQLLEDGSPEFRRMVTTAPSILHDTFHNNDPNLTMTAATI